MPLQKLVGNIYSAFLEILLWLIPIVGAIAGVILVKEMRLFDENQVLGFILGILAGIIIDVICFGPIIIIINIRASLKNIENK